MARPIKKGLMFFYNDVNFYQDIRIRKLIHRKGGQAATVYHILLCEIYRQGYYLPWDDDIPFLVMEVSGFEEVYISDVINYCMEVGLFNKQLFEEEKVLTSSGIQHRYFAAGKDAKRKVGNDLPYLLITLEREIQKVHHDNEPTLDFKEETTISSEETIVNTEETVDNSEETLINSENSTQRKEKKSKEENIGGTNVPLSSSPTTDDANINLLAFQEFFNRTMQEHNAQIPTITQISGKRKQALLARFKEHGKEKLRQAVINAAKSPFLNGASEKPFVASFDWIFRPNNFPKVLEGNYNHDVLMTNVNGNGTSQQLTAKQRIDKSLKDGAEYFAGLVARNEASLRDGVPEKVW